MAGDGRRQQGLVQKGHVAPENAGDSEKSLVFLGDKTNDGRLTQYEHRNEREREKRKRTSRERAREERVYRGEVNQQQLELPLPKPRTDHSGV